MYGARWWLSSPKTQDVVGRGPFVPQDMVAQRSSPVSACGWSVDPAWTKRGQAGDEWPMSPAGAWPDRHRTDVRFLAVPPAPSVAGRAHRGHASGPPPVYPLDHPNHPGSRGALSDLPERSPAGPEVLPRMRHAHRGGLLVVRRRAEPECQVLSRMRHAGPGARPARGKHGHAPRPGRG